MINLQELPEDHPLRNTALSTIQARYLNNGSKIWRTVFPSFGIANATFNQLDDVWTSNAVWEADPNELPDNPEYVLGES